MLCTHYTRWMHSVDLQHAWVYPCKRCYLHVQDARDAAPLFTHMKCDFCLCIQPAQSACANPECTHHGRCHRYFCATCNLWEHAPARAALIFHCDKCGICRVGDASSYRHCDRCEMCVPTRTHPTTGETRDAHWCVGGRSAENSCPVCYEGLSDSYDAVAFLRCGHALHQACLQEWVKVGGPRALRSGCPVCRSDF